MNHELPTTAHSLAEAALIYARAGLRVVPLHHIKGHKDIDGQRRPICSCSAGTECGRDNETDAARTSAGKHPRIKSWQTEATSDEKTIAEWWRKYPKANIGIAMGGPERVVALDIDGQLGRDSLAALEGEHGELPATLTTKSGRDDGGEHRIFMVPDGLQLPKNSASKVGDGLDVRGIGGQVVACPSMHYSGRRYELLRGFPIAEIPAWLHARMVDTPSLAIPVTSGHVATVVRLDDRRKASYVSVAITKACAEISEAKKGTRNDVLNAKAYSLARLVAGQEVDADTVWNALSDAGKRAGLNPSEVEKTIESAFKAAQSSPKNVPAPRDQPRSVLASTGTDGPTPQVTATPVQAKQLFQRGDHVELADRALQMLETSPMTFDDGEFWRYDPDAGIWKKVPSEFVEHTVAGFAGGYVGDKWKPLLVAHGACRGAATIARNTLCSRPGRLKFDRAKSGIAFRDRFVTVEGGEIRFHNHAPEHMARAGLPFDWDPLPHPEMDKFFADLFEGCDDAADRMHLLQEFVGACLLGMATSYQRCLVLYGTGNNGKSQVLDIARAAFPDGTVVSLPPQQWDERFRLPLLVGALANFVGELPNREIAASETFKGVTVGDPQTAEHKGRDAFTFVPRAGNLFGANSLPTAGDITAGFFRRFVILPLTKVFPESGDGVERDIGKRIARQERQAIAAWAVEGARRLQAQGGYTVPPSANSLKAQWTRDSDSVRMFLEDTYEKQDRNSAFWMTHSDVYQAYASWAKGLGFQPVNGINFSRRFSAAGYETNTVKGRARYYLKRRVEDAG